MSEAEFTAPLAGIRVVDLTRALAGPFCTMLLGDQGAEVIKIERPGKGDDTRSQSNPRLGDENTAFLAVNRNKRSVVVDLRDPSGIDLVHRLIATADVLVENFRPGKTDSMGLGWDDVRKVNPRLIYCSISGWGGDGPHAARAGYASIAEAAGGLMSVTGEREGGPVKVGVSIVDTLTGLFAKDAITAALLARERSGRGQKIETSLLESTVSILTMSAYAYLMAGVIPGRWGSEHQWNVPWKAVATTDGYLMLCGGNDEQWQKLCFGIGLPELASDERFASSSLRADNREALYAILNKVFATKASADWVAILDEAGAAVAPVNTIKEVFEDPQVLHRQMLQYVEHTTLGRIPQVGHAQKFFGTPSQMILPPPVLGEHTDQVLREILHCTDREIGDLRRRGVVG